MSPAHHKGDRAARTRKGERERLLAERKRAKREKRAAAAAVPGTEAR